MMSDKQDDRRPLPVLLVEPGSVSREDVKRAELGGWILIVECTNPSAARFLQPPPDRDVSAQATAALKLMRAITASGKGVHEKSDLLKFWVKALLNEEPPKDVPPVKEG